MRQSEYGLKGCITRRRKWQRAASTALLLGLSDGTVSNAIAHARKEHNNIRQLLTDFRFKLAEMKKICDVLSWHGVTARNSYVCEPMVACAVLLFRLATPQRWYDSELKFGMFSSQLSEVFWEMVELLNSKCANRLELRAPFLVSRASIYANAIKNAGAPVQDCIGFIDCTKIRMQRPGGSNTNQRACYSGHKRFHCLNYQSLSTPDGLIFALYGPSVGRRHDLTLLRNSGWESLLQASLNIENRQFYIFGDSAYSIRPWLMRPFVGNLTTEQHDFNSKMSAIRVAVEHNYKDLKQIWVSQDFARNLKVRQAPVALLYKASALLWNFRTCFYKGGQVVQAFQVQPPTFEEYLTE
eukprot:IDg2822t1